ncbi:MAG TPA: clan AA aspartic protease [Bacteroidia bacterium]|jgi:clan AA aspartic protease|nr:clan AA aspartic protease [Bacteroidia bacterium]
MGLIYANLTLFNPRKEHLKKLEVQCLVDSGAMWMCIPEHIVIQLGLEELEKREVTTADGKKHNCPYVGPLQITFGNRSCYAGALVLGDSVLLGAIPMEDMDLVIHPLKRTLSVNPESPNIPAGIVK